MPRERFSRQLLTALASSQTDVYTVTQYLPTTPDQRRRLPAHRLLAATTLFLCRLYLQSSQELHRLQSGQMIVPDSTDIGLARHADNAEAMRADSGHFVR